MPVRNKLTRILKFLGKALLGLILLLILLLFLIHLTSVQRKITNQLCSFLSSKTKGRVEIDKLEFSLLGNVTIEGLQVWDPDANQILSAGTIVVKSNIFDILSGDYLFDEIRIEDVNGKLVQGENGLNIKFILDAFQSKKVQPPDTTAVEVTLRFHKVLLKNIDFQFLSAVSGTDIKVSLTKLTSHKAAFTTKHNTISADSILLEQPNVSILTKQKQDTIINVIASTSQPFFTPDFDIGLGFEFNDLEIAGGDFSFHSDTVTVTPKFDPDHITVSDIQINLYDVLMSNDTLTAVLQTLNAQLPGFTLNEAGGTIKMNSNSLALSALHLSSSTADIHADFTASYDPLSTHQQDLPNVAITAEAVINPADLSYFLNEKMMKYVHHWKTTAFAVEGNYVDGKGDLKKLNIKTANSQLQATGMLEDILDYKNISWNNMVINASVGSDFKSILSPFVGDIKVPPAITVQMTSTGNPKKIFVDGKVLTTWGNAKAKGIVILLPNDIDLDVQVSGEQVQLAQWTAQPWMGPVDLTIDAKGKIGTHQDAAINGVITSIVLMDQPIHQITFQSNVVKDNVNATISVADPRYRLHGQTDISFAETLIITSDFQFDTFQVGRLVKFDSTLLLTGNLAADITIDGSTIEGKANGKNFAIINHYSNYTLDTFGLAALLSPTASHFEYMTHDGTGNLTTNFNLQELPGLLQPWLKNILYPSSNVPLASGSRSLQFDLELNKVAPLQLLGIDVDEFSGIHAIGKLEEQNHLAGLQVNAGKFKGYGVSLDTLYGDLTLLNDSIRGKMNGKNIFYNTYDLGDLNFDIRPNGDTTLVDLEMSHDSASYLGLGTKILPMNGGANLYPYKFRAFNYDYRFDPINPIYVSNSNVVLKNFNINYNQMQLSLNGDVHAFDANFKNIDLTQLNPILSADTNIINKGYLNGTFTYASGQKLDFKANVDSLEIYHSVPIAITMSAEKNGNEVPFEFLLSNASNKVDAHGQYFMNDQSVDASLLLDVNNPEMFAFLYAEYLDDLNGTIKGIATVHGPIKKPELKGSIRFQNVSLTTTDPRLTFNIKDDSIKLDNHGLTVDQFKIYDQEMHPLTISGNLNTGDMPKYKYDLKINAVDYALIDNADTVKGPIKGLLVIDGDIALSGNEKDTYVKADITVKDNTNLTYVLANEDDALLNTIGVVEFIDPGQLIDSAHLGSSENVYDSLVASLPDFNLNSTIQVEKNANLKIITDAQSGDFFEASGGAKLELSQDRTSNPYLSGTYTITKGVYRLSFYDLVKKTFTLVPGSSINWSGSPESGEMDIKAIHTVATNSLGLIGHEIGENEKSVYKRTLEYVVGINIKGTLDKPVITFSLDLPEQDKSSYPVLANKLDRLRLPEFQTELNKQVFGLLVLGGFMPESSMADIDQSQLATTAIYNSVNAILASQLNRFASQYVKGVNIDVGIQSYADYSTPGGKTQTAMDFRVSKSILNDRLSFEVGGDFNLNTDQSGSNTGNNYRGDVAIIYDLTGNGDKQLKLFNNESYDIIYQEIRNTGISLIFIREFNKGDLSEEKTEKANRKSPSGDLGAERAKKAEKKKEK